MDSLTFLAEYRQTQEMFKKSLERVGAYGRKAARYAWRFKDLKSAFAELWLEYRYGWLPVCYALDDSVRALHEENMQFKIGNSHSTFQFSDSEITQDFNTTLQDQYYETVSAEYSVRGWAAANMENPFGKLGIDPIRTTWELVPFSFVIDWFIQIGNWIDAVSPFAVGSTKASGVSIKTTILREMTRNMVWLPASGNEGGVSPEQKVTEEIENYVRYPMEPNLPGWNPQITPTRIIDAVALAIATKLGVFKILTR
jgi:hypothetical protein